MNHQYQPTHSAPPPPPQHQPTEDARVGLIKSIWGCSVGMLGVCIPLMAVMHQNPISALLPFCIIAGATLGTLGVWFGKGNAAPKLQSPSSSEAALQEQIRQLEERLANVETISSFERGLMERDAQLGMGESLPDPVTPVERDSRTARSAPPISY